MIHVTCDLCGKTLHSDRDHYKVNIEIFCNHDANALTEEDLDQDHLEEIAEILSDPAAAEPEPATTTFQYDLCSHCRVRFESDPLSREADPSVNFSDN
ncbi:MAG: hypothetical protein EXR99_16620 [Gemmataceae bacterium]|nr:hypothetical protein [Gemmataceae bacterium]